MKWAYGVTTVRIRAESGLLQETLTSLASGGFDKPRLFIDGNTIRWVPCLEYFEQTCREPALGAYGNWYSALLELFIRNPEAERYAIFQDDLVCVKNLRQYLESCTMFDGSYWNLYTIAKNEPKYLSQHHCNQWCEPHHRLTERLGSTRGFYPSDQSGAGALALVFNHAGAKKLLSNPHMVHDFDGHPVRRNVYIDGRVSETMRRDGWVEYCHYPSLVQHTGDVTTMGDSTYSHVLSPGYSTAPSFPGAEFDALSLLEAR